MSNLGKVIKNIMKFTSSGYCKFYKVCWYSFTESSEGVKWGLGFAYFLAGKMRFHALGLGFISQSPLAGDKR